MIAFGTCVGYPEKYRELAAPGIARAMGAEPREVCAVPSNGRDIFPVYAQIMRAAAASHAEALVLMHDDLELRDERFAAKLRAAFADPDVAVVGLIGARGVTSLAWWAGERAGRVEDLATGLHDFGFERPDVDSVDGMFIALSPWALAHLRLEGLGYAGFHGYDAELCFQARAAGKRVVVADIDAKHHSRGGFTDGLAEANDVFRARHMTGAGA